jgi:hypothetical protein
LTKQPIAETYHVVPAAREEFICENAALRY